MSTSRSCVRWNFVFNTLLLYNINVRHLYDFTQHIEKVVIGLLIIIRTRFSEQSHPKIYVVFLVVNPFTPFAFQSYYSFANDVEM